MGSRLHGRGFALGAMKRKRRDLNDMAFAGLASAILAFIWSMKLSSGSALMGGLISRV